jgi:hypothetical protein
MLIYQRVGISFIPLCRARALVANIIAVDVVLPRILIGACKGSNALVPLIAAPTMSGLVSGPPTLKFGGVKSYLKPN